MEEIHLVKSDFKVEWFSGTGKGGQHRNKHQNCCRITHVATGLSANGTRGRDRQTNQRDAFNVLAARILAHYSVTPERRKDKPTIRNYHAVRNEVHDKASGLKRSYKSVIEGDGAAEMIEARSLAVRNKLG